MSEWTGDLTDEQAQAICQRLLPEAPELITGRLIERIKTLAIAIDPDWARRRYESALAERKVVGNPDGSANLSGYNLPLGQAAAAAAHIDALAKAAKCAGHPDRIDHIRADLFLGLTDGSYTGLDDAAIVAALLATAGTDATGRCHDDPAPDDPAPDDPAPDDPAPDDPAPDGGSQVGGSGQAGARLGRLEVRVRLSTLLGLDTYPGELAGWGAVHAELARHLARAHTGGQWRFALTDSEGQLQHAGFIRRRPTGWAHTRSAGLVELQAPSAALTSLAHAADQLGEWTSVVADLRRQAAHQHNADQHNDAAPFAADAGRRLPGAALSRYVQIRDRRCRFPTCRAPTHGTDTDHSVDHAGGGTTTEANLGELCRHDHRLKHQGRWQLTQPEPGHFVWTSRLGRTYSVRPPPIIELLPDPVPRNESEQTFWVRPDEDRKDSTVWRQDQQRAAAGPQPEGEPAPDPAADIPPF